MNKTPTIIFEFMIITIVGIYITLLVRKEIISEAEQWVAIITIFTSWAIGLISGQLLDKLFKTYDNLGEKTE